MSFIKKSLASIGIGGAKIDTKVYNPNVRVGDYIEGDIIIKGGSIDQEINNVTIVVRSLYEKEVDDKKVTKTIEHQKYSVNIDRIVREREVLNIPFKFKLNLNVPISTRKSPVFLQTQLDIESAVDNFDRDYIEVAPSDYMETIINSIKQLGFTLRTVECEYVNSMKFFQEFEFTPSYNSEFKRKLDELELVMKPSEYGIDMHLEVDRKARGIGGFLENMLNLDETQLRLSFNYDDLRDSNYIRTQIYNTIKSHTR